MALTLITTARAAARAAAILAVACTPHVVVLPASAQERAPTVAESVADGMEVVDPLAFQATAAAWNTFLVRASQLALERSAAEEERDLARQLIDEHAEVVPKLALAAEADGLPTAPVSGLDGRQSGMIGKLEAASDTEFDGLYLDMLVTAHDEAIGLFDGYARNGTGHLQAFAAEVLATLETRRAALATMASPPAGASDANP